MRKRFIIAEILVILLSACHASRSQTPLKPPLPAGTNYFNGMVVSQTGLGIIGCTNQQVPLADGSGCADFVNNSNQFAVNITAPPYNAKCDGVTDDHAAIQSALDQNASVYIPSSPSGTMACNLGTVGITLCSSSNMTGYNAFYGNGQILQYSGNGNAISIGGCYKGRFQDVTIENNEATGTPTTVSVGQTGNFPTNFLIENVADNDSTFPTGSISLDIGGTGVAGDPSCSGAGGITVFNFSAGNGLDVCEGSSIIIDNSTFQGTSIISGNSDANARQGSFLNTVIQDGSAFKAESIYFLGTFALNTGSGISSEYSTFGVNNGDEIITDSSSGTTMQGTFLFYFYSAPYISGTWIGTIFTRDRSLNTTIVENGISSTFNSVLSATHLKSSQLSNDGNCLEDSDGEIVDSATPCESLSAVLGWISGGGPNTLVSDASCFPIPSFSSAVSGQTYACGSQPLIAPVPESGRIAYLSVKQNAVTGTGASVTYTVRKNGTDTAITCEITAAISTCVDATHSFTVDAGDVLDVAMSVSGSPTAGLEVAASVL